MRNYKAREVTKAKKFDKNFYVLDTETSGFENNEPVQIAAVIFLDGEEDIAHNEYFIPKEKQTPSAIKTHGLTSKILKKKRAKEFMKPASDRLLNFLNRYPDLPIVAHNVKYDRDDVLKPAFEKVQNLDKFPPRQRWRCTLVMAKTVPKI